MNRIVPLITNLPACLGRHRRHRRLANESNLETSTHQNCQLEGGNAFAVVPLQMNKRNPLDITTVDT